MREELRFDKTYYFRERGYTGFTECKLVLDNGLMVDMKYIFAKKKGIKRRVKTFQRHEIFTVQDIIDMGQSMYLI